MSGIPIQGTLYESGVGAPLCRADNIPEMVWDGTIPFSTIYANCNIATLTNALNISLKGTGHTIDNKGSSYANMNCISFSSIDAARTINIADGAIMTSLPDLFAQVTLNSQSSSFVVIDPAATKPFYIGRACWLSCSGGSKFVSLTTTHSATCFLNSGTFSGIEVFQLANTSSLHIAALNISDIGSDSIYGVSGTNLYLNYDAGSVIPSPTDLSNFAGTVHYLTMASSSKVQGGELQLANLAALNAWPFTSQLVVGQWGCAQDTGKKYVLTSVSPIIWTEYSPTGGSGAIETLNIVSDGQTSFTLSNTPTSIFGIILNQGTFVKYGTDFTVSGTTLTWLNPNGMIMNIGDTAYLIYAYTAIPPAPVNKYLEITITGTLSTSNVFYPFDSFLTNNSNTIGIMFTFGVPDDFTSLVSFHIPAFVHSSSAGSGPYDYHFEVNYASDGELSSAHSTTFDKTKNFTGVAATTLQKPMFDLTTDLASIIAPGRKIGIAITSDLTHQVALSNATLIYI
jgi:hypothetical protein